MAFELPTLPYAVNSMADAGMCQETLELHHGKHHQTYVTALNGFVESKPELAGKSLEEIIAHSRADASLTPVFNNAGQHWNHSQFWESLSPKGGAIPPVLEKKLIEDFGSVDAFKTAFRQAAATQFGSGWAWLVLDADGKLQVTKTSNAASPLSESQGRTLLTLDVWEHSYYLDFRNRRPDYITNFIENLANFERAEELLKSA